MKTGILKFHFLKKIFYFVLLLCFGATLACDNQSQNILYGVARLDNQNWVLVGSEGRIFFTQDAGATFNSGASPTNHDLTAVTYFNDNLLYAIGKNGVILRGLNFGSTWNFLSSPTSKRLNDLSFVDEITGYVAGNDSRVLETQNGIEFSDMKIADAGRDLLSIEVAPDNPATIYSVGTQGSIYKSVDAGATWSHQTVGTNENLNDVLVLDQNEAWAVGNFFTIIKTENGELWQVQANTSGLNQDLNKIWFDPNDLSRGFLIGNGLIAHSFDGGMTWTNVTPENFQNINFFDLSFLGDDGVIVGSEDVILQTQNFGDSFNKINL